MILATPPLRSEIFPTCTAAVQTEESLLYKSVPQTQCGVPRGGHLNSTTSPVFPWYRRALVSHLTLVAVRLAEGVGAPDEDSEPGAAAEVI